MHLFWRTVLASLVSLLVCLLLFDFFVDDDFFVIVRVFFLYLKGTGGGGGGGGVRTCIRTSLYGFYVSACGKELRRAVRSLSGVKK